MKLIYDNSVLIDNILTKLDLKSYDTLNKARFADSIGIKHDHIQKVISGHTKNPGIKTILAIAQGLECSVDELLGYQHKSIVSHEFLSKDLLSDKKLVVSILDYIFSYTKKNNITPKMSDVIRLLDNIYDYSFRRNLTHLDTKFSEWIIFNTFDK